MQGLLSVGVCALFVLPEIEPVVRMTRLHKKGTAKKSDGSKRTGGNGNNNGKGGNAKRRSAFRSNDKSGNQTGGRGRFGRFGRGAGAGAGAGRGRGGNAPRRENEATQILRQLQERVRQLEREKGIAAQPQAQGRRRFGNRAGNAPAPAGGVQRRRFGGGRGNAAGRGAGGRGNGRGGNNNVKRTANGGRPDDRKKAFRRSAMREGGRGRGTVGGRGAGRGRGRGNGPARGRGAAPARGRGYNTNAGGNNNNNNNGGSARPVGFPPLRIMLRN